MELKKHSPQELYINPPDIMPYDEHTFTPAEKICRMGVEGGEFERAKEHGIKYGRLWKSPNEAIPGLVSQIRSEIIHLEYAARSPHQREFSNQAPKKVRRIVRFGSPGLYDNVYKPPGTEVWSDYLWAANLERFADDNAALTLIDIVAKRYNIPIPDINSIFVIDGRNKELRAVRERLQKAITASGIRIAYFGSDKETEAVNRILTYDQSFIPATSVDVIQSYTEDGLMFPIKNTVHQAKAYRDYITQHEGEEGVDMLVDFAVRIPRQAHTIRMYAPTADLWIAPAPTPKDAQIPLGEMEVRGTTSYVIRGDATQDMPSHHTVIGAR